SHAGIDKHPVTRMAPMRFALLLGLCLLGISAQSAQAFEKYLLCPFLDFTTCTPLTDAAVEKYGLSAEEKDLLAKLRRITEAPDQALLDEITASFAPPRTMFASGEMLKLWFPDQRDDSTAPKCIACGLNLLLLNDDLIQLTWGMQGRFMLVFNDPP